MRLSDDQIKNSTTLVFDDFDLKREAMEVLYECEIYWDNLRDIKKRRSRNIAYYKGDQWGDLIKNPDGDGYISEGAYILSQGKVPMKQNQIRQIIKNLLGQFRDNDNTSIVQSRQRENAMVGDMLSNALNYCLAANRTKELDVRQFEEFLLSGMFGFKEYYGWMKNRNIDDVIIDAPNMGRMFFNTGLTDIRLKEIHTIGEVHDVPIGKLIADFAKNEADEQLLRRWYGKENRERSTDLYNGNASKQNQDLIDNLDFKIADDPSKCRVIEVWKTKTEKVLIVHDHLEGRKYEEIERTVDELDAENQARLMQAEIYGVPLENVPLMEWEEKWENVWYFWFLTPDGEILQHGRNPYDHEECPYTIGLYPLIDGEIFGLVDDIIDQQRYINRLITLHDFVMAFAAKGVLLVPQDVIPDGMTLGDFAAEWIKFNGVIAFKPQPHGQIPKQISATSQVAGINEMLQMQLTLLKEISGVTEAIQGQRPTAGTPSSLYAQQTHNASLSNRDFFEFFFSRKKDRDFKIVKLIQQFYQDERYINVGGKDYSENADYYRPELAKDAEFEMSMAQSSTSTAYRTILDDYLMQFLTGGFIDFNTFLANTSMPFADKIKTSMEQQQMQAQAAMMAAAGGGIPGMPGMDPNMQAPGGQVAPGPVNPQAVNMLSQMVGPTPRGIARS